MPLQHQRGFTLVELAIVLMIIGLLIGGVLRGQEMIMNARLQNIIKQVHGYGGAINTFIDKYQSKPGDMLPAINRLPGCPAGNTNSCISGNGDGFIGTPVYSWEAGDQSSGSENTQFWKHLALSGLITGIVPNANGATMGWGKSHPATSFSGGFAVVTSLSNGASSIVTGGLILQLKSSITGGPESNPVLSSKQASYIDTKMDNGMPQTGDVQSRGYGNGAEVADCEEQYNTTREDSHCAVNFLLNR